MFCSDTARNIAHVHYCRPPALKIPLDEKDRWLTYESEKQKLMTSNLSPNQYELAIKNILEMLGL